MGYLRGLAAIAAGACAMSIVGPAYAICAYYQANYQGGAYGAYAVTQGYCYTALDQEGGQSATSASASSVSPPPPGSYTTNAQASASLATGVLTIDSSAGSASASVWDTFTYTGLPAGGASITATLSISGTVTLTGSSSGSITIAEGSEAALAGYPPATSVTAPFGFGAPVPSSVSLAFAAENGVPVTVFAELSGFGSGGVVDLSDPPTLTLTLPSGADVSTASGVFDNFVSPGVPEPSTWAMMLAGFGGLGFAGSRASRTKRPTGFIARFS